MSINAEKFVTDISTSAIYRGMTRLERFFKHVEKPATGAGCWIWTGVTGKTGYGRFHADGRRTNAHRASWMLHNGEVPSDKPIVCHTCDNPSCVNPEHLFVGTGKDNSQDMARKGRQVSGLKLHPERAARGNASGRYTKPERTARGERNGLAKLTGENVVKIRTAYSEGGVTQAELALQYSVTRALIGHIVRRRIWQHV